MVVVQAGQHQGAGGVEQVLARSGVEPLGDRGEGVGAPDVDGAPVRQGGTSDQHRVLRAATRASTAALSAPRAEAAAAGGGAVGSAATGGFGG